MSEKIKKILKIVLIVLVIIAVLASIAGNIYYFGYKQLEANLLHKGFNIAVAQIINSIDKTGQVQISDNLILVPK